MGGSLVGICKGALQKPEINVPPGNFTADISAGLLVEPYVRERFRETGKAR
ncbi:MAG: hypothetical protein P8075_15170 [Deltaproteobacteria bacterium]